jgi:hypothetical protein
MTSLSKYMRIKPMTKYHAKRTEIDGITFDSMAEGEYYRHLKKQQEEGKIEGFTLQPAFVAIQHLKRMGRSTERSSIKLIL